MAISASSRARSRGFSLLEVLLVLVLVATVAVTAVAGLNGGLDGMRLRSAARGIATELRHARAQAIASGQIRRFEVDPAGHVWTSAGRRGQWHPSLELRFTGARELQPAVGVGSVVFFADGASSGGRIELRRGTTVMQIDVAWLTGQVRVRKGGVRNDART